MRSYGWDYSEHPNSSDKDHKDGVHCEVIYDETIQQYVSSLSAMPMLMPLTVTGGNWKTANVMK